MLNRVLLWVRNKVDITKTMIAIISEVVVGGIFAILPEFVNYRIFGKIPFFSFYHNTLDSIKELKSNLKGELTNEIKITEDFGDIKKDLNFRLRKRLAILVAILAFITIAIGILS